MPLLSRMHEASDGMVGYSRFRNNIRVVTGSNLVILRKLNRENRDYYSEIYCIVIASVFPLIVVHLVPPAAKFISMHS